MQKFLVTIISVLFTVCRPPTYEEFIYKYYFAFISTLLVCVYLQCTSMHLFIVCQLACIYNIIVYIYLQYSRLYLFIVCRFAFIYIIIVSIYLQYISFYLFMVFQFVFIVYQFAFIQSILVCIYLGLNCFDSFLHHNSSFESNQKRSPYRIYMLTLHKRGFEAISQRVVVAKHLSNTVL